MVSKRIIIWASPLKINTTKVRAANEIYLLLNLYYNMINPVLTGPLC